MPLPTSAHAALRSRLRRRFTWPAVDALIWIVAVYASVWIRYDFRVTLLFTWGTLGFALLAASVHVLAGFVVGPYLVSHRRGSFEEIADLARTFAVVLLPLLIVPWLAVPHPVPRTTAISAGTLALLTMLAARLLSRARHNRRARLRPGGRPALIYGAGSGGARLVTSLLADETSHITPVGLLDDDPSKARLRIGGVRVVGGRAELSEAATQLDVDLLVLAMPSAAPEVVREISEAAREANLDLLVLPRMSEMMGATPTSGDLRDLDLADVLGRPQVHLDADAIRTTITGRTVLVTGAGGSIGSELCRQIVKFEPKRLVLLDRDESGLQATDMSIRGDGLLTGGNIVLADIRDADRMREVMARQKPDIVFHAAALKHLPLLQDSPFEAWKSNVLGTLNVLRAADEAGVESFVNISTDKAADPTSVLGTSKRLGELLTSHFAGTTGRDWVSVRFGNVLGSRGSVVHAFTTQIQRGGPVTVTHPEVQRYFMLIPEACQLVLQASAMGSGGEVMVLEMQDQVKIVDLARTLITLSGRRDVPIVFTGLRPGEKLQEELFSAGENRRPTVHPLVDGVDVPAMNPMVLARMQATADDDLRDWMESTVRAYAGALTHTGPAPQAPRSAAKHRDHGVDDDPGVGTPRGAAHVVDIPGRLARQ